MPLTPLMKQFSLVLFLFLVVLLEGVAQPFNVYLNDYFYNQLETETNDPNVRFHTAFKPYITTKVDSSWFDFPQYNISRRRFVGRVADNFLDHYLIRVDTGDFLLNISPLFDFTVGTQFSPRKKSLYTNTRGVIVTGAIGKDFAFGSSFYENQAVFPDYIGDFIDHRKVVPGQGWSRSFKEGEGHDYNMSDAYISYSPGKYFNFQLGHGKHFIGDGYRSLLLSDNSFNYPYFKITTEIWRLKYINLWAQFQDTWGQSNVLGRGFPKKWGSFHFLSLDVSKRFQLGFFESIIWQGSDSAHHRGFDFNYINPVIFYRPVEFSLGSPDNALMGLTGKFIASRKLHFYGQFVLDDFYFNELKKQDGFFNQKYGFQIGLKYKDLGLKNSVITMEMNQVRPYTYVHKISEQNYTHYNQPLAHPMMANFREFIFKYNLAARRWVGEVKAIHAIIGKDLPGTNYGHDIFIPERSVPGYPVTYGNFVGQGVKTTFNYLTLSGGYLINPRINMRLELSYTVRMEESSIASNKTNFFSIAWKTGLRNFYYDF